MIIGVASWELEIIGAHSLKEKRSVVKSLKSRLHNEFNVSAAETAHLDVWQRAEITVSVVAGTRVHAEEVIAACDALIAAEYRARIIAVKKDYL